MAYSNGELMGRAIDKAGSQNNAEGGSSSAFSSEAPAGNLLTLEDILDSPAKKGILRFFQQNRHTMDTADGLALWIGFPPEVTVVAAEALVEAHLLERIGEGKDAIYVAALTSPACVAHRLENC
ncbi:MAG: hypothetical protein HY318_12455 [Armatimonadetes bacterium]|nr:hypothetical protein [Armatimonadota bacterium]